MDANPTNPNQYYTHPIHQLTTSQPFDAQTQPQLQSQTLLPPTHDSTAPAATDSNGAPPTAPGRTNAILVQEANGSKRRTKADEFRLEVEERTRNGESCEQISAALNARGVQVTDKTISRWRITWGLRKRPSQTPLTATVLQAVRKSTKPLKPDHLRLNNQIRQQRRKAEITRMSEQSLTPEEIATIMAGRGMSLKDGAKTILRLQTVWGLRELDLTSRQRNARHNAQRQAKNQQEKEFTQYARELGLDNPAEWVKRKMNEPQVLEKRKDQTMRIMTEMNPELISDSPGPGRGRRSIGATTASDTAKQTSHKPNSHANAGDTDADGESVSPDTALQNAARRTLRSTQRTTVPASQPPFADNEDGDPDDSDFEPEAVLAHVSQPRNSKAVRHPATMLNNESDDDAGSNFHFDPDLPQGIDHDDDTGSESEVGNGNVEHMEIDASGHTAPPAGSAPASYAHATTTFAPPSSEFDALRSLINSATACINAAQSARDTLEARLAMRPTANSLTGMPPSAQDVEAARYKLKDAARLILETL
ncbi:hypothetical protein PG997_002125 [Apiospora hydei]|uniref:Uncharacterized protein n=1 Tax=Apiospora hydei TaxID=1337664 RepID=A0ABR1X8G6_9PEZI